MAQTPDKAAFEARIREYVGLEEGPPYTAPTSSTSP